MSYLLLFIYAIVLLFVVYRAKFFQSPHLPKYIPSVIFLLKFAAGISVYLVYAHFYGTRYSSDIFKYFDDGNIIYSALHQNPVDYLRMLTGIGGKAPHLDQYYYTCYFWIKPFNYGLINDNLIVIRFNALIRLISMGNFHIHTLFMSFISFTGLWAVFKIFEKAFIKQIWALVFVIFFIPSVYFWTSGLLKEGILMFAFGLLLYFVKQFELKKIQLKYLLGILSMVFILLLSKFYVLVAAIPGIIYVLLTKNKTGKFQFVKFIAIHLLYFSLAWFSKPLIGISFPEVIAQKQKDFITFSDSLRHVGSKIDLIPVEATVSSILKATPQAFLNTLFRPTLFEADNLMMLMAALENLLITIALLTGIIFFTRKKLNNNWFWFSISFTLILFVLSGITTPVLGALVRYKAPALPFLGVALLFMIDFDRLKKSGKRLIPF
ncbi:MAG: hypothetical protein AB7S69_03325 [Salinivirgaceae bacterium]